jgi:hypothetical protein
MLIGYVRVSKSDGSLTLAPQRDALLASDVAPERIYQDLASGLLACLKALHPGYTLVLWILDRTAHTRNKESATCEKVSGVGDCDCPDLLVRDADLAQVGDCIPDVEEVAKRVTLVEPVDRSRWRN